MYAIRSYYAKSNAHGPNEFLDIATGKRITACVADVLADHAPKRCDDRHDLDKSYNFV